MRDEALRLAATGFAVFPIHTITDGRCSCGGGDQCSSPGKHPKTPHGVQDATTEAATVDRWWGAWPDANIGIACGRCFVVDCDGDAGITAWDELQAAHTPAPTVNAQTGGGGRHFYFRVPDALHLTNRKGSLPACIDVRGSGGYVLAPPSTHRSGRRYAWMLDGAPFSLIPSWLVALLTPKVMTPRGEPTWRRGSPFEPGTTPYGAAVLRGSLSRVTRACNGERNQTLAREAFILGQWSAGGEIDPAGLDTLLIESCPDEDHKKTETTVRRQLREGAAYPRRKEESR